MVEAVVTPVRHLLALLLIAGAAGAAAPTAETPDPIRIVANVTDRAGRPLTGLTVKDFELRDDGVVQPIESVEARTPAPRRLAILLDEFHVDAADSARVRDAVAAFVRDRLRDDDRAVVLKPLDPLTAIQLTGDRDVLLASIKRFEGRQGNYEPRSVFEEETLGRAPRLVEASRVQVVLSALRALTTQLGSEPGRSAVIVVSEGFTAQPRRLTPRGLPDVGIVGRFANRYDVPIYAVDPRPAAAEPDDATVALDQLVSETGGTLRYGPDVETSMTRAASELDGGYTIVYRATHSDDGRYHPVRVTLVKREADARARAGYVARPSEEMRRAMRALITAGPGLPTRGLHRSPFVDVWSGVTRLKDGEAQVTVTWQPDRVAGTTKSPAARVALTATTREGKLLFEGILAPVRVGEGSVPGASDRAEFPAPPGTVQLDMTIVGISGDKLDVDTRDLAVPEASGDAPLLLPPILIATQSAREFRDVASDADAAPEPSREFRRTERLVIRVPAYAAGSPVPVTARLLNRVGQPIHDLPAMSGTTGVTQFDLSLAPFAPGDYFLQFSVESAKGPVSQRVSIKVTG